MKSVLLIFLLCAFTQATYIPKLVQKINVDKPAFANLINSDKLNKYHLAISSFNGAPFSADYVFYYSYFNLNETSKPLQLNNKNLVWPNEISYTNESILNDNTDPYGGLIVAGGFLVPSKENGGIFYYHFTSKDRSQITQNPPYEITLNSQGKIKWFYHRVIRVDISGDNVTDLLTCRSYKPLVGATQTQLVGFVLDPESLLYVEKVILNDACDIFFDVADLDNDGRFEIISAGFFISKLNLIYSDDPNNSFLNGNVKVLTLDNKVGKLFDVKMIDLDQDGSMELLVTNHQGNKDKPEGRLFYYKMEGSNVRTAKWSYHLIYNNFPVLKSGIQQAAPGGAKAFYPNLNEKSKPYILVSGDGATKAYLFAPLNTKPVQYNLVWTETYKGYTVGGTAIGDLDGDGLNEFIIPIYENNTCYIYSLTKNERFRLTNLH
ncbi:unnamed protein product [Brachionus calyciflorus]|uniref:VCBS repeat-containing protein n=1 Tax=Brachionus calyciflorus TaxID=104777 RepID=A0A813PWI0_9BILA|nr:unnamed protein product [Brachionus calyciflorus]